MDYGILCEIFVDYVVRPYNYQHFFMLWLDFVLFIIYIFVILQLKINGLSKFELKPKAAQDSL